MKEIIAIINQKGGVGKSTTAGALGSGLRLKGERVLFIDMDSQGNLSYIFDTEEAKASIFDVLVGNVEIEDTIQETSNGDIIQFGSELAGADSSITETGKEFRLKESLESVMDRYDYIIIDTPPAMGVLTINALTAATCAIIPAQADIFSLQGISKLSETIGIIKRYTNRDLRIGGILLTRHNSRSILTRDISDIMDETAKQLNTKLFKTPIREAIAIKEAQANKQDIFSYSPKSNPALDYMSFIEEFLKGE